MATLYRKYRPQNFEQVVGQKAIKITLENQIQSLNISHAYLFCGPRAVGKTTLARVFAKSINCLKRKDDNSNPCNECEACEEITNGSSLDVMEIDAASHTGVDNVRENIIAQSRISPSSRKYKVFIIDEVHMLSISAFNALLKTLEEPPENVIFILCTTEVHKMPSTIISRCQRFDFKKINVSDVVAKLKYIIQKEEIRADKNILESIARHSEGHMRDDESLLGQIVAISGKNITQKEADLIISRSDIGEIVNLVEMLEKKDSARAIRLSNKVVDEGVDLKAFISDLIEILRKILISKVSPGLEESIGLELGENLEMKINNVSSKVAVNQLIKFLNKFLLIRNPVRSSFIIQLPLELAVVELCLDNTGIIPAQPSITSGGTKKSEEIEVKKDNKVDLSNENIKIDYILAKWSEVLAKVKTHNHSLSFILRACKPREINKDGKLCLSFKYKFHKERLDDSNIKELVEKTLNEVFGSKLAIETNVDEKIEINNNNENNIREKEGEKEGVDSSVDAKDGDDNKKNGEVIDDILRTFKGKIVN